eukprot:TRINITY_DN5217_c0_g2_i16.p1 TRINITY_DN5217_c0_g2~~TRINITY_DN5217_c0_g2_i16.p1  ORF type:complete len:313 (+),score=65.38 TRINITY_DN5217_c0_g2_i16:1437-2375(+)
MSRSSVIFRKISDIQQEIKPIDKTPLKTYQGNNKGHTNSVMTTTTTTTTKTTSFATSSPTSIVNSSLTSMITTPSSQRRKNANNTNNNCNNYNYNLESDGKDRGTGEKMKTKDRCNHKFFNNPQDKKDQRDLWSHLIKNLSPDDLSNISHSKETFSSGEKVRHVAQTVRLIREIHLPQFFTSPLLQVLNELSGVILIERENEFLQHLLDENFIACLNGFSDNIHHLFLCLESGWPPFVTAGNPDDNSLSKEEKYLLLLNNCSFVHYKVIPEVVDMYCNQFQTSDAQKTLEVSIDQFLSLYGYRQSLIIWNNF